jgi:hypothetical protein
MAPVVTGAEVQMASYPNFLDNLQRLIDGGAIPPTPPGLIGDHVKQAINDLTEQDLATLIKLSETAKAHLFVHDKNNHVIAMGL